MNTVLSNKKIIEILTSQRDKSEGFKYIKRNLYVQENFLFVGVARYISIWYFYTLTAESFHLKSQWAFCSLRFIEKCHTPMTGHR